MYCDTSKTHTGSSFWQIQDGKPRFLGYACQYLPEACQNYSVTELEITGLALNIHLWKHLLLRVEFDCAVDYRALPYIMKSKNLPATGRIIRLLEHLSGYCFNLYYIKGKELYYENAIKKILKEEMPRSLHGSGYSHDSRSFQDPASTGQMFSCNTKRETPVCKKKALPALVPAIAGLATIAVESLNSFLQRKRNKAIASGLMAISKDQSLAWNSLKQLENDFLLYGKYNVTHLQDILTTINGLRNRTMQIEKLLTGQDLYTLQIAHMVPDATGRMTFMHKLNLYVHSVLECQIRLYEWVL